MLATNAGFSFADFRLAKLTVHCVEDTIVFNQVLSFLSSFVFQLKRTTGKNI
jgi:hypothetical protein